MDRTDDDETLSQRTGRGGGLGLDDTVDLAGMGSFPASDPPAWTGSHAGGPADALPRQPVLLHDLVQRLRDDVHRLSEDLGERNDRTPPAREKLEVAANAIAERLRGTGLPVKRRPDEGPTSNIEAVILGGDRASESIVVGAHYDTARGSPGADDNATGVAALLALAQVLQARRLGRTVRLVAFAAEEHPHTRTRSMGSVRYADDLLRSGPTVTAMISLEMLGVYPRKRGWPLRLLPPVGADLLFVGDLKARGLAKAAKTGFEQASALRAFAVNLPLFLPGVRASDHWSFAKRGIPAIMVTDGGPLRNRHYHRAGDQPWRIDYDRLGRATVALAEVIRGVADR